MEPKNEGLKDDSPFQPGNFQGSMLIFQGISSQKKHVRIPKFGRDFSQLARWWESEICDGLSGWLVNKNSFPKKMVIPKKIHGTGLFLPHEWLIYIGK